MLTNTARLPRLSESRPESRPESKSEHVERIVQELNGYIREDFYNDQTFKVVIEEDGIKTVRVEGDRGRVLKAAREELMRLTCRLAYTYYGPCRDGLIASVYPHGDGWDLHVNIYTAQALPDLTA